MAVDVLLSMSYNRGMTTYRVGRPSGLSVCLPSSFAVEVLVDPHSRKTFYDSHRKTFTEQDFLPTMQKTLFQVVFDHHESHSKSGKTHDDDPLQHIPS